MKLDKLDSALIFKLNGDVELVIPKFHDDDMVKDNTQVAVTLGILLKNGDKELTELINRKLDAMIEECNDI